MTRYLVQIAVGPVQEFILHARRSRDLWFGSHILSELSRGIARSLAEELGAHGEGFELVFPALAGGAEELRPCRGLFRDTLTWKAPLAISNIVLAHSPDLDEAALVSSLAAARNAALKIWRDFAGDAADALYRLLRSGARNRIVDALDRVLEMTAAWEPLSDPDDSVRVRTARDRLSARIASRKNLRDFAAWDGQAGLPKSSLDGFRETVFRDDLDQVGADELEAILAVSKRYRIPLTEHLDGLGVVKRAGGTPRQFIPLARIALAPWIAGRRVAEPTRFAAMVTELETLLDDTTLSGIDYLPKPWLADFPFDGEVFLEDQAKNHIPRKRATRQRVLPTAPVDPTIEARYEAFREAHVRPLLRGRRPDPYIACLVADGDRMGEALDARSSLPQLHEASRVLGDFAGEAREIILEAMGNLVYAGGDDVLAFVPVTRAVEAAATLAERFVLRMAEAFPGLEPLPTLSVGIGVGHVLTPMGELLQLGRDAEKLAKTGPPGTPPLAERNALAILSMRRGGARTAWRRNWLPTPAATASAVSAQVDRFLARDFPHGLPYEVRSLLSRFPDRLDPDEPEALNRWAEILAFELRGTLVRKRLASGTPADIDPVWQALGLDLTAALATEGDRYTAVRGAARGWIDGSLVIRHLALAARAARRAREGETA